MTRSTSDPLLPRQRLLPNTRSRLSDADREQARSFYRWLEAQAAVRKIDLAILARSCGISPSTFTHWKQGGSRPSEAVIAKLAAHLSVPKLSLFVMAGHLTSDDLALAADLSDEKRFISAPGPSRSASSTREGRPSAKAPSAIQQVELAKAAILAVGDELLDETAKAALLAMIDQGVKNALMRQDLERLTAGTPFNRDMHP